jgi:ABC-type multidrug transport system ATPase subunit
MSDIVIHAEGLGKRYRRGLTQPAGNVTRYPYSYHSLSTEDDAAAKPGIFLGVARRVHGSSARTSSRADWSKWRGQDHLAQNSFAHYSPYNRPAEIHGRVRSLLEVGTGFHGELSGRENTYFSSSILGMGKREIDCKFDEIVAFAEIDKFIDTPVKHYSSGMYVRLAFAVAAHLEPEILLVDEVLAVGDVQFQKKCLGKMKEVGSHGRTIVFVSHNVNAIASLSTSAMVLAKGSAVYFSDNIQEALRQYLDRWEARCADTRIHGTTKRQVATMFAEEKPSLLALPIEFFRYYQYGERVVHLDDCVEVEAAYYGLPRLDRATRQSAMGCAACAHLASRHESTSSRTHSSEPRLVSHQSRRLSDKVRRAFAASWESLPWPRNTERRRSKTPAPRPLRSVCPSIASCAVISSAAHN